MLTVKCLHDFCWISLGRFLLDCSIDSEHSSVRGVLTRWSTAFNFEDKDQREGFYHSLCCWKTTTLLPFAHAFNAFLQQFSIVSVFLCHVYQIKPFAISLRPVYHFYAVHHFHVILAFKSAVVDLKGTFNWLLFGDNSTVWQSKTQM